MMVWLWVNTATSAKPITLTRKGASMATTWACKNFGINCDFEASGETEEEMKKRWSEHAHAQHPVGEMPDYIRDKVRAAIPEDD